MALSTFCPSCKNEISATDKFCRNCGTLISQQASQETQSQNPAPTAEVIVCNSCGIRNASSNVNCKSCGSVLGGSGNSASKSEPVQNATTVQTPPLKSSQTWRITLGIGIFLILVVIVIQWRKDKETNPEHTVMPPTPQLTVPENVRAQLQAMEDSVKAHPEDLDALLKLANTLQDNSQFTASAGYYQQYIQKNPGNPDARVDLGVTYFELSRVDSVRHREYLALASQSMQEALKINPKHQMACFNLGIVSFHMGDMEQGLSWLKQCIDIDSTNTTGRNAQMLISQHSFKNP